jgi:hypothetical protein
VTHPSLVEREAPLPAPAGGDVTPEGGGSRSRSDPSRRYAVFGGVLRTELEFPDLMAAPARNPDWNLRIAEGPAPARTEAEELGRQNVGDTEIRLSRSPGGVWLSFPPFGEGFVANDGRELVWYTGEDTRPEFLRAIVLGPLLGLALHAAGTLCLHGSGVVVDGEAIGLLAPKFHGKSTLASALVNAGASLVTDDTIAVDTATPDTVPIVRPGVPSLRLWADSTEEVLTTLPGRMIPGEKNTFVDLPRSLLASHPLPLGALYLLYPAHPGRAEAATRARLDPPAAAVALACHTKLVAPLVGLAMAGQQLRWAAAVARSVPVYTLQVVRDFGRLSDAVQQILRWHAPDGGERAAR